ncbi:mid region of cactin-domain-containing protein [Halteromyces radiatus]|uniref:mid region of cactin-domain-containing protein n=1 Tax=Halteromyces radiatus TaxID=101107 RepID=UPI00221FE142|nr:mid region of cactin-domain-containing protein [Halteromyces radiatus]KAI8097521.1 mid region of cactin-domain-containing protein [Halteromyces radiatus]
MPRSPERYSRRDRSDSRDRYKDEYKRKSKHRHRSESPDRQRSKDKKRKKSKKEHRYHSKRDDDTIDDDLDKYASNSRPSLEQLGYSNVNNPFNDINLESKFVWGKKKQRDRKELGLGIAELKRRELERKREADEELAKLNKRRAERELERKQREAEMEQKQRDAELAQMGDWHAKEEEFHLEQAKRRAEIRIKEGRAKPIDILAMNLRLANEPDKIEDDVELEIDLEEPYTIFDSLSLEDTEELEQDIEMHLGLEKNEQTLEFWRAMMIVAKDKLEKLEADNSRVATGGVAGSVNQDIHRILQGKTYEQLMVLQQQVMAKLASNQPIDVEYWENLLKELVVYKAKARLNTMHQALLAKRLQQLREKQHEEALKVQQELGAVLSMQATEVEGRGIGPGEGIATEAVDQVLAEQQDRAFLQDDNQKSDVVVPYEREMSPEPMEQISRSDKAELSILDPIEDMKQLIAQRRKVLSTKIIPRQPKQKEETPKEPQPMDGSVASSVLYEKEKANGIDDDEAIFNIEAELAKQTYLWQDKYRPRKPRYFNRVHTGYEWNKYNQTHYDFDNPPPKVVQGYKFNIFYPDLIDKSKAPTYFIEKDPESPDTVLIRFQAGPPYEDIAFRIVKREWEYSHKKGFKCTFDRGVLSLWFHFKRQFYRK